MDKSKILMIDDKLDFLEIMGERIRSWGYEVITTADPREALAAVADRRPDAIILDYKMPEMDGVDTLRQIRKIDQDIPVIMFTAYPDVKSITGTEELGVSSYIPKMSTFSDVQTALKSAIEMALKRFRK